MDPLSNLADIHLPDPVSAWPPAYGWWLVALLLACCLIAVVIWLRHRHQRSAYRREALAQLNTLKEKAASQHNPTLIAAELSALLKQVAITLSGRKSTASLTGEEWLKFLDDKGRTSDFTQGQGRVLGADIYKPNVQIDLEKLFKLSQQWIKKQS